MNNASNRCSSRNQNQLPTVNFGRYSQWKRIGYAPIEWLVLRKEEDRMLLLSKYALDCQQYHTTCESVSWRKCSLRGWLNYEFLNKAFSEEEQKRILTVLVEADQNPKYYHISPGDDVWDKVFLLSICELNRYFSLFDDNRLCAMTDQVILQCPLRENSHFVDNRAAGRWWLRTPGSASHYAASVYPFGSVDEVGSPVNTFGYCVRPALWLSL